MSVSGKLLAATVNGVSVRGLHRWRADDSGGDVLDATTGDDDGYTNTDTGCEDLRVDLELLFDLTTGTVVNIKRATILTDVALYVDEDAVAPVFLIPTAVVIGRPVSIEVRGRVEVTCTIKNKGAFTDNMP